MALRRRTLLAAARRSPSAGRARAEPQALTLAIARDIQGALDPATRLSSLEANILRAVCPGLIAFKPGSFDWQPMLASSIRQESPHRHLPSSCARACSFQDGLRRGDRGRREILLRAVPRARPGRQAADLRRGLGGTRPCRGHRPAQRPHPAEVARADAVDDRAAGRLGLHHLPPRAGPGRLPHRPPAACG